MFAILEKQCLHNFFLRLSDLYQVPIGTLHRVISLTMATTEIIYSKNELLASMAIKKIKILAAVLELLAKWHCRANPAYLPQDWAKLAKLAVLFSW